MKNTLSAAASRTLFATLVCGALCGLAAPAQAIGSLADIQVYDRMQNRFLPVYWHEGRAYVVGEPGNEYQIRVANRAGADVMTVVSVDGVNVVTGETASPEQSGYVFGGRQQYDIKGWRKSLDRTAAFYFTTLPDAYAARTGRPDNVGVIGMAVFRRKPAEMTIAPPAVSRDDRRRWSPYASRTESAADSVRSQASEKSAAPSATQSASQSAGQPGDFAEARPAAPAAELAGNAASRYLPSPTPVLGPALGTGHGRSETSVVRNVAFERATSLPEETVTLYYDSRRNLMARGIIPPAPVAVPQPQPFPGRFVADPPRS